MAIVWAIEAYLVAQVAFIVIYGIAAGVAVAAGLHGSENVMIGLAIASLLLGAAVTVRWPLSRWRKA